MDEQITPPQDPQLAPPTKPEVKLDLACGQCCKEGFEGVDIVSMKGVKHVINLMKFPWPWEDNSVDEIYCSHFVEHLPMVYVGVDGAIRVVQEPGDKELFFAFFDECWRILRHEGKMTVLCPSATSDRAFQDPTHRRFIVKDTWAYLSAPARKSMGLGHYNVKCSFAMKVDAATARPEDGVTIGEQSSARIAEVQQRMMMYYRNFVMDWVVVLLANKKGDEILNAAKGSDAAVQS
jgi:hypothetical protein